MKIEVTTEDIVCGAPENPEQCPVALAITRALRTADVVFVNGEYAEIQDCRFELPQRVKGFIRNFDDQLPVSPFAFDLPLEDTV